MAAAQDRCERLREVPGRVRRLIAHHQRDDRRARRHSLQKRQLHLERVLAGMRRRVLTDDRRGGRQLGGAGRIDRCHAEGRLESAGRHDCDTLEPDEVRGSDEHCDINAAMPQQPIRVRGNWTRIHQSSMGRDESHELPA